MAEFIKPPGLDFKINNLIEEYDRFSLYFCKFQEHIEKCYKEHILSIKERNNYINLINGFIRQLNTTYNVSMIEINEEDTDTTNTNNINNANEFRDLMHIHKVIGIKSVDSPFDKLNDILITKFGHTIGFPSLHLALSILIDYQYKYSFDNNTNNLIKFYNNVFIPLKYDIQKIKPPRIDNCTFFVEKIDIEHFVLFRDCVKIYIKHNNEFIVLSGYFIYDSLNILVRTSQLCNNWIYHKKKELENFTILKKEIGDKFLKSYMRNVSLCDIVTLDNESFFKLVLDNYKMYNRLSKLSFIHLMKEFIKDDINQKTCLINMYNIINLLLIGSGESVNIAGLLFGITKEKKMDSEFSISDIIYKNLSYVSQIKLRKTNITLKAEMDKIKSMSVDDIDLKKQVIVCKNMPPVVKKLVFEKIEEMKLSNNEYYKQLLYVKTLLNFPWPSSEDNTFFTDIGKTKEKSKEFLNSIIKKLDDKVYGHNECKETIKELIGKWICCPTSSGSAIGLAGPPGVGKTLIAKAIGESLGIPFVQITLGGQNDGELLHGHGYTYSGSQPGMIVKKMVESGSAKCVMYFDELDKACKKYESNEIYNILIHITDPNTNTEFQDRFFQEIKFPLNKVLFIFSYNDSSSIDNILMDRIEEINVKSFKLSDKKIIIDKFLIKEMSELIGFENGSIKLNDDTMDFLISRYTNESGVRDLKRKLEKIFLKLNIERIYGTGVFEKNNNGSDMEICQQQILLTKELVESYLGKNTIHIQYIHTEDLVGVINGLYATDNGQGGILPIQIYDNYANDEDKFTLKITGNQRKIMQESIIAAFTVATHCVRPDLRDAYFVRSRHGVHIHAISLSIPKSGPSAGVSFACGFISRILNKKIKHDIAMTGEIELTGKITKIGGLQYKLYGAKKAGVRIVFVPEENKEDIDSIKKDYSELFDDNFVIILANHITDVLKHILVDYDASEIIETQ